MKFVARYETTASVPRRKFEINEKRPMYPKIPKDNGAVCTFSIFHSFIVCLTSARERERYSETEGIDRMNEWKRRRENDWTGAYLNYGKSGNFANEFLLPMGICRVNNTHTHTNSVSHTIETRRLFPQKCAVFFPSRSPCALVLPSFDTFSTVAAKAQKISME